MDRPPGCSSCPALLLFATADFCVALPLPLIGTRVLIRAVVTSLITLITLFTLFELPTNQLPSSILVRHAAAARQCARLLPGWAPYDQQVRSCITVFALNLSRQSAMREQPT